jgi:phosphopantetheinyl transferase (holo-ACP synthase)
MLSPVEQDRFLALELPDNKKAEWLFGRAVAKDAVRMLQRKRHGERHFMADIEILDDELGRPVAQARGQQRPDDYPRVSTARAVGHIAAIAATTPYVGIEIDNVKPREDDFEETAFDEVERKLLDRADNRDEWIARFWCAKEAIGKALRHERAAGPRSVVVRGCDASGAVDVLLSTELASRFSDLRDVLLRVTTRREEDLVVATTVCEAVPAGLKT